MTPFDASTLSAIASVPRSHRAERLEMVQDLEDSTARRIGEALVAPPAERKRFPKYARDAAQALERRVTELEETVRRFRADR